MSIRTRTQYLLLLTLAGLVLFVGMAARYFILRSYRELETRQTQGQLLQVCHALTTDQENLQASVLDWAHYDSTYRFVARRNPTYLRENFQANTLPALNVSFIIIYDRQRRVRYSVLYDARRHGNRTMTFAELHAIGARLPWQPTKDLLVIKYMVAAIATSPVTHSDGKGPMNGWLLMGRFLDADYITRLGATTRIPVAVVPWTQTTMPADFRQARQWLARGQTAVVTPLSATQIAGYTMLSDITRHPVMLLRVTSPRDIMASGRLALWQFILITVFIGLVVCGLALWLLDRQVLARVERLLAQIRTIEAAGDHAARVTVTEQDELGQLAGAMNGMLAALEQAEASEVARAYTFLKTALDTLPFPMVVMSPQRTELYTNAAAQHLHALLGGRLLSDFPLLHPVTLTPLALEERPIYRIQHGESYLTLETVAALPDGQQVPVLLFAGGVRANGELVAVVFAGQDITELKNANHMKDEFLAVVSHELLTPLTSMLGWAEMAVNEPEVAIQTKALEIVLRNARRQKHLVDDLLDMSRLLHHKLVLMPESVDLSEVAAQCLEDAAPAAARHTVTLTMAEPAPPMLLQADALRLRQVIGNLLDNALKFTPPGGTVTLSIDREGDTAVLRVRDTGRGLSVDALTHVFHPFQQVPRDEASGGLGLGLALVQGIIELHGGTVTAESAGVGHGSTFTLTLPLHPAAVATEMVAV